MKGFIARIITCMALATSSHVISAHPVLRGTEREAADGHLRLLKKDKTVKGDVTEADQPTPQVEDAQIEAEQPICDEDECLESSGTCTLMEGEEWRKGWRCRTATGACGCHTAAGTCDTIYHCFDNPCNNAVCADGKACQAVIVVDATSFVHRHR